MGTSLAPQKKPLHHTALYTRSSTIYKYTHTHGGENGPSCHRALLCHQAILIRLRRILKEASASNKFSIVAISVWNWLRSTCHLHLLVKLDHVPLRNNVTAFGPRTRSACPYAKLRRPARRKRPLVGDPSFSLLYSCATKIFSASRPLPWQPNQHRLRAVEHVI